MLEGESKKIEDIFLVLVDKESVYDDPIIMLGSDGQGRCALIEILNEDKIDTSFWTEELQLFFDESTFKIERGLFKVTLVCKSYQTFNGETTEWDYDVGFLSTPEKIYDWGDLSC